MRGEALRWALAGAIVTGVYAGLTLLLAGPLGLHIQGAIPIAYVSAVALHFSLQRWFVFRSSRSFALAVHHQIGRYVAIGACQYALTAAGTAILPPQLGVSDEAAYLLTLVTVSGATFLILRSRVFHAVREPR